jgi:uncharacterized membrane protein (Fun14 family)
LEYLTPLLQQLGFGGIAGLCVGYFTKKAAKVLALLLGCLFILLQVLAYYNIVSINWGGVSSAWDSAAESGAIEGALGSLTTVLLHNLPFGAAFLAGFAIGVKKG